MERLLYVPENRLQQHGVNKVGVVALVVREGDGHVYLVEELEQRSTTGKIAGVINPPCETRKSQRLDYQEFIAENVQAVLANELGITDVHPERKNFFYFDGTSYRGRYSFPVPLSPVVVHADAVAILYTGTTETFRPLNPDEILCLGFFRLETILTETHLRPGVRGILMAAHQQQWIDDLLTHAWRGTRKRRVFPDEFSIDTFLAKRDHQDSRDIGDLR